MNTTINKYNVVALQVCCKCVKCISCGTTNPDSIDRDKGWRETSLCYVCERLTQKGKKYQSLHPRLLPVGKHLYSIHSFATYDQ